MQSKSRQRSDVDDSYSPDLNYEKSKGYIQPSNRSKSARNDTGLTAQEQNSRQRIRAPQNNSEQLPPYMVQKYGRQQTDFDNSKYDNHKSIANVSQKFPIHASVVHNDIDEINNLVNKGYGLSEQDNQLRTPLHIAVYQNNLSCVENLLQLGANTHAVDGKLRTPLHLVCLHNCTPQIALVLIQKGKANVSCQDHKGNTPLHILSQVNRSYQVAEVLLANGADPNIKNESGVTPLECASYLQVGVDEHYIICLLKYGASLQQEQSATLIQNYLIKNEDLDRFSEDHKQVLVQFTLAAVLAKQVGSVSKMVQICIAKINEMNKLQQSVDNNSEAPQGVPHYTKIYQELVSSGGRQMEKFDEIVQQINLFRRDIEHLKDNMENDSIDSNRLKEQSSRQLSKNLKGSNSGRTQDESGLPDEKYWIELKRAMTNMQKMQNLDQQIGTKSGGQITEIFEKILNENSSEVKTSIIKGVEQIEEKTSNVVKEFLKSTISDVQELKQKLLKNDSDINQEDESMTEKIDDFLEAFQEFVLYQERIQSGLLQGVNKLQNQIGTIQNEYNNLAKLTISSKVNELKNENNENQNESNKNEKNIQLTTYEDKIKQLDILSVQHTQNNITQVQDQLRNLGSTLGKIHDIVQESEFKLFANEAATFLQDFREDVRANFTSISDKLNQHFMRMEPMLKSTANQQTKQNGQSALDNENVEKFRDLLGLLNNEITKLRQMGDQNQEVPGNKDRSHSVSRHKDIDQLINNTRNLIEQNNQFIEQQKRGSQSSNNRKSSFQAKSPDQSANQDSDRQYQEISQGMSDVSNQVINQQSVLKELQSDLRLMKDQVSLDNAVTEVSQSIKSQLNGFMYDNHKSMSGLKQHINEIVTRSTSSISDSIQRIDTNIQKIVNNLQNQSNHQHLHHQGLTPTMQGGANPSPLKPQNQVSGAKRQDPKAQPQQQQFNNNKPQAMRGNRIGEPKSFNSSGTFGMGGGQHPERFNRSGSFSSSSIRKPNQQAPSTKGKQIGGRGSLSQPNSPHNRGIGKIELEISHEPDRELSMDSFNHEEPELQDLTESIFELFKNSQNAKGNISEDIKHKIAEKVKRHDSLIEGPGDMYGHIPLKKQQSSMSDPVHPQSNHQINNIAGKLKVIDQGIGSLTSHVESMQESMNQQNSEIHQIRDQVKNLAAIKKTKDELENQRQVVSGGSGKDIAQHQKVQQILNQRITSLESLALDHNKQMTNVQGRLDSQQAILRKILEKVVIIVNKQNDYHQSVSKSRMLPDPPSQNLKLNGAHQQEQEFEIDSLHEKWNRNGRLGRGRRSSREQSKDSQFFPGLKDRNYQQQSNEDTQGSLQAPKKQGSIKQQSSLEKNLLRNQSSIDKYFGVNGNTYQVQGELFDDMFSNKSNVISKSRNGYIFKVDSNTLQRASKLLANEAVAKVMSDTKPLGQQQIQQFEKACQIRHKNVARLMAYGESQKFGIFMLFEYFDGNSLDDVLSNQEVYRNSQLLPENRLKILQQICSIYQHLKEQGMESNIQPNLQKILINERCDTRYLDVGMSVLKEDYNLINNKFNFSNVVQGEASDVQCFGLLVLQLLTGIRNKKDLDSFFIKIPEILNNQNLQQDLYNYTDNSNGEWPYFLALNLFILAYKCLDKDENERPNLDNVKESIMQLQ